MNTKKLSIVLSCLIGSAFCGDSFMHAALPWFSPVKRGASAALSWTWRGLCSRYGMLAAGALVTWGIYRFYARTPWESVDFAELKKKSPVAEKRDSVRAEVVRTLSPSEKIANRGEGSADKGIGNSLTVSPDLQYAAYIKDCGDTVEQEDKRVVILDLRAREKNQQQNSGTALDAYEVEIAPEQFGQKKGSIHNVAFTFDSKHLIINGCNENKKQVQWACDLATIPG